MAVVVFAFCCCSPNHLSRTLPPREKPMIAKGGFLNIDFSTDFLLVGTCVFTAFPLLLFTAGARRTTFATVGFMQYIAPSCSFLLAIFVYNEPFSFEKLFTFIMIWIALIFYTIDSVRYHKNNH